MHSPRTVSVSLIDCVLTNRRVRISAETVTLRGGFASADGRRDCLDKTFRCPRQCVYMGGAANGVGIDPTTGEPFKA
jgi:hypothetical protein